MSLYKMSGNGEFQLNNGSNLCPEIIPTGKDESKRHDIWSTCQIFENQDKNDSSNPIGDSIGWMLRINDNNLIKYGQQTAIAVIARLAKFFHIVHLIKSHFK